MKINRQIITAFFLLVCTTVFSQVPFSKAEIKGIMKQVADWQIKNPSTEHEHHDLDWTNGALYVGMAEWAGLAEQQEKDSTYYQWLYKIGSRNGWQPYKRMYHADDIAVSQFYRPIRVIERNNHSYLTRAEWIVNHSFRWSFQISRENSKTVERWTWLTLFMAPPFMQMYAKP